MIRQAIIDTGPLVAFLDRNEKYHKWAVEQIKQLKEPLLVCAAVLTEAMFLLKRVPAAQVAIINLLENGALAIKFDLMQNTTAIKEILKKYDDIGISLADAWVIRMAELNDEHLVFTMDSDFQTYRKHKRQPIKLIFPDRQQK